MFCDNASTNVFVNKFVLNRPTSRSGGTNQNSNGGVSLPSGLADDQSKDFDFEKTEMKYDSTGMFHWSPARNLEDCILVSCNLLPPLISTPGVFCIFEDLEQRHLATLSHAHNCGVLKCLEHIF